MANDFNNGVLCPLVDRYIDVSDCDENKETASESWPQEDRQKPGWEELCRNCKWHNH